MTSEKIPLQTIRKHGKWYIWRSVEIKEATNLFDNAIENEQSLHQLKADILDNETFKEYHNRDKKDKQAVAIKEKNQTDEHETAGYHRHKLAVTVTGVVATIGAIGGLLTAAIPSSSSSQNTTNYTSSSNVNAEVKQFSAVGIYSMAVLLNICVFWLNYSLQKIEDAKAREKKLYEEQRTLLKRIPLIEEELKLKRKVLLKFDSILNHKIHSLAFSDINYDVLRIDETFAEILDGEDDLTVYKNLEYTLALLSQQIYIKKPLEPILLRLLKEILVKEFFFNNVNVKLWGSLDNIMEFSKLLNQIYNLKMYDKKNVEVEINKFLYNTLCAILSDKEKFNAIVSIRGIMEDIIAYEHLPLVHSKLNTMEIKSEEYLLSTIYKIINNGEFDMKVLSKNLEIILKPSNIEPKKQMKRDKKEKQKLPQLVEQQDVTKITSLEERKLTAYLNDKFSLPSKNTSLGELIINISNNFEELNKVLPDLIYILSNQLVFDKITANSYKYGI